LQKRVCQHNRTWKTRFTLAISYAANKKKAELSYSRWKQCQKSSSLLEFLFTCMKKAGWMRKNYGNLKGEVVTVSAMMTYTGSRAMALHILNFSTRWRWQKSVVPWLLYLEEGVPVPIKYEAAWAPELVWEFWRREKSVVCLEYMVKLWLGIIFGKWPDV